MTSINRQRANLIFSTILSSDKTTSTEVPVPSPAEIASQERIFPRDGILQWKDEYLGTAEIGISLATFFQNASSSTGHSYQTTLPMGKLQSLFAEEKYILFLFPRGNKWHASILLKKGCPVRSQLKAWTHALLAARVLSGYYVHPGLQLGEKGSEMNVCDVVQKTLGFLSGRMEGYLGALAGKGWEVDIAALETRAGRRIC